MGILIRKGRAIAQRARPNSVNSEGCFSKGERGKGGRIRKRGICHGWRFEEVSLSRGIDRHEEQGAGLGLRWNHKVNISFTLYGWRLFLWPMDAVMHHVHF